MIVDEKFMTRFPLFAACVKADQDGRVQVVTFLGRDECGGRSPRRPEMFRNVDKSSETA